MRPDGKQEEIGILAVLDRVAVFFGYPDEDACDYLENIEVGVKRKIARGYLDKMLALLGKERL